MTGKGEETEEEGEGEEKEEKKGTASQPLLKATRWSALVESPQIIAIPEKKIPVTSTAIDFVERDNWEVD